MADSLLGKQLDEYRLEKLLGQGGMARVYRGLDTLLKRYVAIKVIDAQFRDDSEYSRRFELEAQSLGQLNHPNVVQLYRYGRVDDVLYMAMSYIEGSDVKAALDDYQAMGEFMALDEALRILRESAAALDYIHSRGIIHRDIKPSNIMLDKDGRAVLADFGLALMTQVGTMGEIFGTPQYLSPEQAISSAAVVPQSDLYSLGIIAYEMFTGRIPFDGTEPMTVAIMHMNDTPPAPRSIRPELTEAVEAVLLKAIEKEASERYQTGAEFVQALEAAVKGDSELKRRTTMPRLSIPQIVALEMEKNPLPPIPAAVTPMQKKSAEMPSITERAADTAVNSVSTLPHQAVPTQPSTKPPVAPPPTSPGKPRTAPAPKRTTEQAAVKAKPNALSRYLPYVIGGTILALVVIIGAVLLFGMNRPNPEATASAEAANSFASTEAFTDFPAQTSTGEALNAIASTTAEVESGAGITPSSLPSEIVPTQLVATTDNSALNAAQTQAAANIFGTQTAQAQAPIVPTNTAAPQTRLVQIRFTWDRNRWLLIENRGGGSIELARLRLTEVGGSKVLSGESFGEGIFLEAGQCVAFAERRRADDIEGGCGLRTDPFIIEGGGGERFWQQGFNVFYVNGLNTESQRCAEARNGDCLLEFVIE